MRNGGRGEGLFPPSHLWATFGHRCASLLDAFGMLRKALVSRRRSRSPRPRRPSRAQSLPTKLADTAFWRLVTDFSEPSGMFRSDNLVSNETTLQWVIPELQRTTKPGGVYLGVGPDQNFTYIVALKPKIAFIFDIRRQNMLTHLMYKALIEQSTDRADFISRLFCAAAAQRARYDVDAGGDLRRVRDGAARQRPFSQEHHVDSRLRSRRRHGFKLSDEDLSTIAYVYESFVSSGPGHHLQHLERPRRRLSAAA